MDKPKSLRERNAEKAKIEQTLKIEKELKIYCTLVVLLFFGIVAMLGVIATHRNEALKSADKILAFQSSPSIAKSAKLALLVERMKESLKKADEAEKEIADKAQQCGVEYQYDIDIVSNGKGEFDETKCLGTPTETSWHFCEKRCQENVWSDCQLAKMKELGIENPTCKWWVYTTNHKFMMSRPNKIPDRDVYLDDTGKWCYMFRDWDTLPKLRRVYNGIGDSVHVGIADCQYSRFSERWQDLNEAIEADVFKIVENAARIKSFVTGKCHVKMERFGSRDANGKEEHLVKGQYAMPYFQYVFAPGQLATDVITVKNEFCPKFCDALNPKTCKRSKSRLYNDCYLVSATAADADACQNLCEAEPMCMAWTWDQYGGDKEQGNYNTMPTQMAPKVCKMYQTAHYKQTALEALIDQDGYKGVASLTQITMTTSGTRGCEPTDLSSRHFVSYRTTPKIWLPCGTVIEDQKMTGTPYQTYTVADRKACAVNCTEDVECQIWTFESGTCSLLKTPGTEIQSATGTQTGSRNCNDFCNDGYDLATASEEKTEANVPSAEACRAKCAASATCEQFAYTNATQACRLLDAGTRRSAKTGVVSGPWHCTVEPVAACPESVDMTCEYMRKIYATSMPWETCAAHCKADPNCKYWLVGEPLAWTYLPALYFFMKPGVYNGGTPCYLYDTDAGRTAGNGKTKAGSVSCQAGKAVTAAANSAVKHLAKPFRRPFVDCLHPGMKIADIPDASDFSVLATLDQCMDHCAANPTECAQVSMYTSTYQKLPPVAIRENFKMQGLMSDDDINAGYQSLKCGFLTEAEATAAGQPTCDKHHAYAEKGCRRAATAQALRHYPEHQASFVGFGCHAERCALGPAAGDHVANLVQTPQDCVALCASVAKDSAKEKVDALTYSPGYRTCYCHLTETPGQYVGEGKDFFPDPNEEHLLYVLA